MLHLRFRNDGVLLLRTQLMVMVLPLILLPALAIGYVSYNLSYNALKVRSANNADQVSSLLNQNLDNTLQQVTQLAQTPLYTSQIQQIVTYYSQHPEITSANLQDEAVMSNFFLDILIRNESIVSVDIYTQGNITFNESFNNISAISNWKAQSWYTQALQTQHPVILPTHSIVPEQTTVQGSPSSAFSVAQAIVNTDTFQPVGVMLINLDAQILTQMIDTSQENTGTQFLIYDTHQKLVYPVENTSTRGDRSVPPIIHQQVTAHTHEFMWNATDYFLSSSTSPVSQWTVVALIPTSRLTRDIEGIRQVTILVVILSLVVALGAFVIIINAVGRLVTRLRRLMSQVEKGNLDVRFQNRGRGEIIQLGQSFNRMVARLKQVIQDNYEAQIQRQKVEIAALQSRINPHFLYNTLASLQMIALTEGCERVASMSYDLGQLMRYALATEELVSLEQELENTKHFLALMQERYGERLSVTLSVDADLCHYMVPKLMLQPLVENAIAHGIDSKFGTGYVQVCGTKQHNGMVIEVRDDGVGILPDKLAQLQEMLSYEANILKRSQHIGMGNVQGQIQRLFGREYGITLHAIESGGTRVSIYLPMKRE